MSLQGLLTEIDRRVRAGLLEAVEQAATHYREEASAQTYPPRSSPGDYPAVETGQGLANIAAAIDPYPNEWIGRMGLYGAGSPIPERGRRNRQRRGGMHMWWVKTRWGRKSADNILMEYQDSIAEAFKRGASS